LAEHFVVLDRQERHDRIVSELDVHARRLGGRVQAGPQIARLLQEVPDLVEYPSIVAGTFAPEFLDLPPEVLTMTMVHHQHFFPVASGEGRILPAFLAVTNTAADNAKTVARNAERVLTARLRDARFFWQADRRTPLASKLDRLETVLFHQALGTYRDKAERLARLARWIAANQFLEPQAADAAATAGLLAKLDLTTDLVREFTDLQGTMGGIYAREDGQPESIWKAIYHHYLPVGVEPDAPPAPKDLGAAAIVWAAVSLADKIDTLTGLMLAGERPTGSRDPFGIRRQAHGLLRILVDLPELTGLPCAIAVRSLVEEASALLAPRVSADGVPVVLDFVAERLAFLFEQRGVRPDAVRAVLHPGRPIVPLEARRAVEALERARRSSGFETLAMLFKRVKNIAKELPDGEFAEAESRGTPLERVLTEPAERALLDELDRRASAIRAALDGGATLDGAFAEAAALAPAVDRFFIEILVMADDPALRQGRLRLLQRLRRAILDLADISELAPDTPGRVST
jgi:glycyl-tRNA synthetase beta chain